MKCACVDLPASKLTGPDFKVKLIRCTTHCLCTLIKLMSCARRQNPSLNHRSNQATFHPKAQNTVPPLPLLVSFTPLEPPPYIPRPVSSLLPASPMRRSSMLMTAVAFHLAAADSGSNSCMGGAAGGGSWGMVEKGLREVNVHACVAHLCSVQAFPCCGDAPVYLAHLGAQGPQLLTIIHPSTHRPTGGQASTFSSVQVRPCIG